MNVRHTLIATVVLVGWLTASGCDSAPANASPPPAPPGRQFIVAADVSASRTPTQFDEARSLLVGIVKRVGYGDRFALIKMYQARSDKTDQWDDTVPALRDRRTITSGERNALDEFHQQGELAAVTMFDTTRSKGINTTDILQTIARASDYARAAGARNTTLVVLSDMLNATPEVNMERAGGVPDSAWIAKRKAAGRLPDLTGVCVFAVGADVTSQRGAMVRAFWEQYFTQAGARMPARGYRNMVFDPAEIKCE